MRMEELKVKVVSLGDEIRYIRKRRKKYQRMASTAERADRVLEHEGTRQVRDIIRELHTHELELVAELRATHLARAFFRGVPWSKLEPKASSPEKLRLDRLVDPSKSLESRVLRLCQKFGGPSFHRSRFDAWLFRARADLLEAAGPVMRCGIGRRG